MVGKCNMGVTKKLGLSIKKKNGAPVRIALTKFFPRVEKISITSGWFRDGVFFLKKDVELKRAKISEIISKFSLSFNNGRCMPGIWMFVGNKMKNENEARRKILMKDQRIIKDIDAVMKVDVVLPFSTFRLLLLSKDLTHYAEKIINAHALSSPIFNALMMKSFISDQEKELLSLLPSELRQIERILVEEPIGIGVLLSKTHKEHCILGIYQYFNDYEPIDDSLKDKLLNLKRCFYSKKLMIYGLNEIFTNAHISKDRKHLLFLDFEPVDLSYYLYTPNI